MHVSICKLCLLERDLQQSHLIPAAVYRLLNDDRTSNPNPVLVTTRTIVQTSMQTKAHLLCKDCEQLLSKRGEGKICPLLARADGSFPFFQYLCSVAPDTAFNEMMAFAAARNFLIPVTALTHFALGIFWKAAVHNWSYKGFGKQINLGPYAESLRCFLLASETEPFPDNMSLIVAVLPPHSVQFLTYMPAEGRKGRQFHNFTFYVPGIQFVLSVGGGVDPEPAFQPNPLHPILLKDISEDVQRIPKKVYETAKTAMNERARRGSA